MKFGIIADDNTGATDAAGMLTGKGVRTLVFIDAPSQEDIASVAADYDAVAIGTQCRSIDPKEAYRRTFESAKLLSRAGAVKVQVKYCSTFDSTPEGNIGPTLDAAMDALGARATVVTPALPVNGRTTYCGYHFVNGQLLSESPLRSHPINPMSDSNLVRWLQRQTKRVAALADLEAVRKGEVSLREFLDSRIRAGESYFITDAIEQRDLTVIARATADWPLISGGSGITAEVPDTLFPRRAALDFSQRIAGARAGMLAVAGSCSPATREQNSRALAAGFTLLRVDGAAVLGDRAGPAQVAAQAVDILQAGRDVLLSASGAPRDVELVQALGRARGLSACQTGEIISDFLADAAAGIVAQGVVGRLVVSGGETSGAVCRKLAIRALEVGLPIEPGVPCCFTIDGPPMLVVLKSGNFGSPDFYLRVRELKA